MFKTQIVDSRNPINPERAEKTYHSGEPTLANIRIAVEWALTGGWEDGRFDASQVDRISVAVWHHDVLIGVYTMEAEEVCPKWHNLTERPF